MPCVLSTGLDGALTRAREDLDWHASKKCAPRLKTRHERFRQSLKESIVERGHRLMNLIRDRLASLDKEHRWRTQQQREIQDMCMTAVIRFVYQHAMETHEVDIMDYNDIQQLCQMVFICMPRRAGKTTAIVMLIAVLLLCVPNIKIICISPAFRAGSALMQGVKEVLASEFHVYRFEKSGEEVLQIKRSAADIRSFCSYPGGSGDK
jgi:hypothetical protein